MILARSAITPPQAIAWRSAIYSYNLCGYMSSMSLHNSRFVPRLLFPPRKPLKCRKRCRCHTDILSFYWHRDSKRCVLLTNAVFHVHPSCTVVRTLVIQHWLTGRHANLLYGAGCVSYSQHMRRYISLLIKLPTADLSLPSHNALRCRTRCRRTAYCLVTGLQ